MSNDKFSKWHDIKQSIDSKQKGIERFKEKDIFFLSVGQNIGFEVYGKQKLFLRPVLVYKKLSKHTFIGIPLSSQKKEGSYFFSFNYKKDIESVALFHQVRVFDIKRADYFSGRIKDSDFGRLKSKFIELLQVTPSKKGSGHASKGSCQNRVSIISEQQKNVKKVFIIAEAGVNHNGSVELAKKLIDVASDAGADAVKFQTFKAETLVSKDAQKAQYQKENIGDGDNSQFAMLKKLELDLQTHKELIEYCHTKEIIFLSTPFDLESIELLDSLGLEIFKIPSGEITNLPYLRAIAKLDKEVILSTGMATIQEVRDAFEVLVTNGTKKENISILHANTMYPTPMEDVNLNVMLTLQKEFGVSVGYSDHTLGIEVPIASVAMGASCIEKHFTLSRDMEGPDHKASLEPQELKVMVSAIRNIQKALGSFEKKASPSETPNIVIARKSIVVSRVIKEGDVFSESNLSVKRPAGGINPMRWDEVIGSVAKRDYDVDEMVEE